MAERSICQDCFHSYVCEQYNENKDDNNEKCHFFNNHFVPTADVVPRSEYESLRKRMFPSHCQAITEEEAMKIGYERGKVEVAAEIFEEIDDIFLMFKPQYFVDAPNLNYKRLTDLFSELKKKYTEKGNNND